MKFEIEETDEFFTSRAGLALIGQLLGKTDLMKRLDAIKLDASKRPDITHGENAISMIALLAMGKPDFDAIKEFRKDDFSRNALNLNTVPSEGTLRHLVRKLQFFVFVIFEFVLVRPGGLPGYEIDNASLFPIWEYKAVFENGNQILLKI